jgi:hypothetical protein
MKRARLLARALTVRRKAEDLMHLVTTEYGPESHQSDTADSVVHMCEVLTDALSHQSPSKRCGGEAGKP